MLIDLDARTRILPADRVFAPPPPGAAPIDPAADVILILDPRTSRPVAICRPIGDDDAPKKKPGRRPAAPASVAAAATEPEPEDDEDEAETPTPPAPAPAVSPAPAAKLYPPTPAAAEVAQTGRLTTAQTMQLAQLWRKYPAWDADAIADEFASLHGRSISEATAAKYRPGVPALNGKH